MTWHFATRTISGRQLLYTCFFALLGLSPTMAQSPILKSTANKFSLRLHDVLRKDGAEQNLFYSPSSIMVALAMTYLGARGNTAKQMFSSFNLNEMPEQQLKHEFHKFLEAIDQSNSNGNKVSMANRLFAQMGFDIAQSFQDETNQFFNAQIALVDYRTNSEGARNEVNKWVEEKTQGKIKDLIPEGMFDASSILTLVNAIYFKGSWMNKFEPNATQQVEFQVTPTQEIKVPMMYQSTKFKYIEDSVLNCQIIDLPYAGNHISMIVLLPNEMDGLSQLEKSLSYDQLSRAISDLKASRPQEVEVSLPKFKMTGEFSLKEVLTKMGAVDMFNTQADFTGISAAGQLYVSEVVHKAFVDVNEEGTEAAAATGVGIALMSMPMNPVFFANHPFLFLIHHNKTGVILFLGRVAKPQQ